MTGHPPHTHRILTECETLLARIGTRYGTTVRRLTTEVTPGFPAHTPASGEPGGGSSGPGNSRTERLAGLPHPELDDLHDALWLPYTIATYAERTARGLPVVLADIPPGSPRATLRKLVWSRWLIRQLIEQPEHQVSLRHLKRLHPAICDLDRIVTRWGYTPHRPSPVVDARLLADDPTGELCRSCLRVGRRETRHRGDLCRWCYDFERSEGFPVPPPIIEARGNYDPITENMVVPHRQAHRDRTKKRRRKTG